MYEKIFLKWLLCKLRRSGGMGNSPQKRIVIPYRWYHNSVLVKTYRHWENSGVRTNWYNRAGSKYRDYCSYSDSCACFRRSWCVFIYSEKKYNLICWQILTCEKVFISLMELLGSIDFKFGTYVWDARYKGLDDFVWFNSLIFEHVLLVVVLAFIHHFFRCDPEFVFECLYKIRHGGEANHLSNIVYWWNMLALYKASSIV